MEISKEITIFANLIVWHCLVPRIDAKRPRMNLEI